MGTMEIVKVACLFVAILFTIINAVRAYHGNDIPMANFLYHAIGLTGFIYLQWIAH